MAGWPLVMATQKADQCMRGVTTPVFREYRYAATRTRIPNLLWSERRGGGGVGQGGGVEEREKERTVDGRREEWSLEGRSRKGLTNKK